MRCACAGGVCVATGLTARCRPGHTGLLCTMDGGCSPGGRSDCGRRPRRGEPGADGAARGSAELAAGAARLCRRAPL
eukprot:1109097-Prymnesium_polylepis.1